jgi:hypothetical protein
VPALRNSPKPPARVIRRGTRILKPAASTAGGGTVTYDTAGATVPNSSASPITWTHVNSGNCVVAGFIWSAAAANPVTAVTYGGVTLPLITSQLTGFPGGGFALYGQFGATVPTGSNTVSVTYTTGGGDVIASSVSASGVGGFGTPVSGTSNAGTSFTVALPSTTAGGLIVVGTSYGGGSGGGTFSGTNSVTIRWSKAVSGTSPADNGACGTVASTGAAQTVGISDSAGADWFAMAAVELLPTGGAPAGGLLPGQLRSRGTRGQAPDAGTRATYT